MYDDERIGAPERPAEPAAGGELRAEVKRLAKDVRNLLRANGKMAAMWADDQERIQELERALGANGFLLADGSICWCMDRRIDGHDAACKQASRALAGEVDEW